jgi:hypothetical protein
MRCAPEKTATVSAVGNDVKQMEARAGAKKDFETEHSSVFATPGLPLAHFLLRNPGLNELGRHLSVAVVSPFARPCCLMTFIAIEIIEPTSLKVAGRIIVFPV